jgi:hypothetical protein
VAQKNKVDFFSLFEFGATFVLPFLFFSSVNLLSGGYNELCYQKGEDDLFFPD